MPVRVPGNPSVAFIGRGAKRRIIESIKAQRLVSADDGLARRISRAGVLAHYKTGAILLRQGDPDNQLLMILSGQVIIQINGREVARREAGQHVGEMALVDTLATRSATVVAATPTSALHLSEPKFSALARTNPELWRRVAAEIAARLRERSSAIRHPNDSPVVFVGSSTEALSVANEVYRQLDKHQLVARNWTDGVFEASKTAIESLVSLAATADFACLVLSADDVVLSRGKRRRSPRDNVVFELGLLIGSLGRERVFLLKPKGIDVRIPSDLLGVVWLEYARGGPNPLGKRLRPACKTILQRVQSLGPR